MSEDAIEELVNEATTYLPRQNIDLLCAADIEMRPINWLWEQRIALGKISVLAGQPGLGKSQITAAISAHVTNSLPFPDGYTAPLGDVLILSAEDDPADTIKPRLFAAKADMKRCHILNGIKATVGEEDSFRLFDLSEDIGRMKGILECNPDINLIIIDPVSAYQGEADSHNNSEIRALLSPYSKLAEQYNVAILLVTHFNKSSSQEPIERIIGSIGLIAAARAGYAVMKDPQNEDVRHFIPLKNNIGDDRYGFSYHIEGITLENSIQTSRIVWSDESILASKIFTPEKKSQISGAKDFLQDLLSEKPLMASKVFDEAEGMGYSKGAIQRANRSLGVRRKKLGMREGWLWYLEGQEDQVSEIMKSSESS